MKRRNLAMREREDMTILLFESKEEAYIKYARARIMAKEVAEKLKEALEKEERAKNVYLKEVEAEKNGKKNSLSLSLAVADYEEKHEQRKALQWRLELLGAEENKRKVEYEKAKVVFKKFMEEATE